jgi:solute carrier family 25 phosphate transporter 3
MAVEHDAKYYGLCMFGGVLSCGLTHTGLTPLDMVKCNIQANPTVYNQGMLKAFGQVSKNLGGPAQLTRGWAPTAIGYSMQGFCKFGFYEIFKDLYKGMAEKAFGEDFAWKWRTSLYLAASASAELIADVALCPMESVKVRVQTSEAGTFPTRLMPAATKMFREEGINAFYKGLSPLWMRQVPYTMVKFACFERTVEAFYTYLFTKPRSEYSRGTQLGITFASGYIAGVFCAIVSHPSDSVVSVLNKQPGKKIGEVVKELGMKGMWRGLGARIIMIGTLTGAQWWIYDTFKTVMGLGTSGAVGKKK